MKWNKILIFFNLKKERKQDLLKLKRFQYRNNHVGEHFKLTPNFFLKLYQGKISRGTLSVKFGIYVH
jgi:hypothetical protein